MTDLRVIVSSAGQRIGERVGEIMKEDKKFTLFKEYCELFANYFGQMHWCRVYFHEELESNPDAAAYCDSQVQAMQALIGLSPDLKPPDDSDERIILFAFHEIFEMQFAKLRKLANSYQSTPEQISQSIHEIISTMENTIFPLIRVEVEKKGKNAGNKKRGTKA